MQYSLVFLSVVGAVVAQDLASLPACGQTCITNMIGIASSQFGCAAGDVNCYCSNIDFGYGVRDCSNEACGSSEEANQVISYGTNYCAQAIASASSGASSPAQSVLSSALEGATGTTEVVASTPVTTRPLETTVVSDGQTQVQTTGFVTEYAPIGAAASSAASEASDAVSSLSEDLASATSALSDALNSLSSTLSEAASSAASEASAMSTSSPGAAPVITAAPILGGAALAAMLFI